MADDRDIVPEYSEHKITVREVIVVEGKYDKMKLSSIVNGVIITTDGFRIFKNPEKRALLRVLAREKGIVILTDSDGAGFKIRSYMKGIVEEGIIKNAFIPDILGVEKRKTQPSKEGKLGVEGMSREIIEKALEQAGVNVELQNLKRPITKADLYELGLSGKKDSHILREKLCGKLKLPRGISSNDLLGVLNLITTYDELKNILEI